ncbi:flagellar biosynthesis repressor FlbT, partial [Escherichia coli]|nr:flagellar biosynthesis repressor FlbT [Escherichia coli]
IEQLSQVLMDADSRKQLNAASSCVVQGHFYNALKAMRSLLPREERLLAAGRV